MFPNLPRNQVQLCSFLLFIAGALAICLGGWENHSCRSLGITLMAGSIWFITMSESILLTKVQNEMHKALESLNNKREGEIADLLYFLRQSKISADPMSSTEAAGNFTKKILFPAMMLTNDHKILQANQLMTNLLGYCCGELDNVYAHRINDIVLMSKIGELCSAPEMSKRNSIQTRYVYISKQGKHVSGVMCATRIGEERGFFVVFHPDSHNIIQDVKDYHGVVD